MKQILLLVAIHLLIFHQYKKDKKEQKNNLSILLQDLQVKQDSFLYVTVPTRYNFTDYSFLFKKTGNKFNGSVQKKNTRQRQIYYRPFWMALAESR